MEARTRWLQPPPRSLFVAVEAEEVAAEAESEVAAEAETEEEEVAAAPKMIN